MGKLLDRMHEVDTEFYEKYYPTVLKKVTSALEKDCGLKNGALCQNLLFFKLSLWNLDEYKKELHNCEFYGRTGLMYHFDQIDKIVAGIKKSLESTKSSDNEHDDAYILYLISVFEDKEDVRLYPRVSEHIETNKKELIEIAIKLLTPKAQKEIKEKKKQEFIASTRAECLAFAHRYRLNLQAKLNKETYEMLDTIKILNPKVYSEELSKFKKGLFGMRYTGGFNESDEKELAEKLFAERTK